MPVRIRCPDKPRSERHQRDLKVLARLWQSLEWRVMGPGNQTSASYVDQSNYGSPPSENGKVHLNRIRKVNNECFSRQPENRL